MDHFRNPRNVGVIEDADGVGEVGNAVCGDIMTQIPLSSKSRSRLSPSIPSKQKLTLPESRFIGSPFRMQWGILESPVMSSSRKAETLAVYSSICTQESSKQYVGKEVLFSTQMQYRQWDICLLMLKNRILICFLYRQQFYLKTFIF